MTVFYTAPGTAGNRLTIGTPGSVAAFLTDPTQCAPGNALEFADGTYTGASYMIQPVIGTSGAPGAPITLYAKNDGAVTIDGQGARTPVFGNHDSDYYTLIGFNAKDSSLNVYALGGSIPPGVSNWTLQRCIGWDVPEGLNRHIFSINYGGSNLLEDCAGFGVARKIFVSFSNSGPNTLRRCWARWQRSLCQGPKQAFSTNYTASNTLMENCLSTWDDAYMPVAPYTLVNNNVPVDQSPTAPGLGCIHSGPGLPYGVVQGDETCLINSSVVDQPYGPDSSDGTATPVATRRYGNIAYQKVSHSFRCDSLVLLSQFDGMEIKDCIAIYPAGFAFSPVAAQHHTFNLGAGSPNCSITNATSFTAGGNGNSINAQWAPTNVAQAATPAALYTNPGETMYNTSQGASIRYRYVDGVLTSQELWPWPMSQRIFDALATTTYATENVDTTIQAMFGTFPVAAPNGVWFV